MQLTYTRIYTYTSHTHPHFQRHTRIHTHMAIQIPEMRDNGGCATRTSVRFVAVPAAYPPITSSRDQAYVCMFSDTHVRMYACMYVRLSRHACATKLFQCVVHARPAQPLAILHPGAIAQCCGDHRGHTC